MTFILMTYKAKKQALFAHNEIELLQLNEPKKCCRTTILFKHFSIMMQVS